MKYLNKFAVVTGASTGIGRATAIELGKNGATVGLVARNKNKLEETKMLVERVGGTSVVFEADLANIDSINNLIKSIKEYTEHVDMLINIAGVWHGDNEVYAGKDFDKFNQQTVLGTFSVGLIAPTLLVHGLLPKMPSESNIVNLSGTFENGAKGWLPYYVSKKGIEDLTLGLSDELKEKEIYVNCISPSDTATDEYKKYFPEDAINANSPEAIAQEIANLIDSGKTGQFVVVKKGVLSPEGYHK